MSTRRRIAADTSSLLPSSAPPSELRPLQSSDSDRRSFLQFTSASAPFSPKWVVLLYVAVCTVAFLTFVLWLPFERVAASSGLTGLIGQRGVPARHWGIAFFIASVAFLGLQSPAASVATFRESLHKGWLSASLVVALALSYATFRVFILPAPPILSDSLALGWLFFMTSWLATGTLACAHPGRLLKLLWNNWAAVAGAAVVAFTGALLTKSYGLVWNVLSSITLRAVAVLVAPLLPEMSLGPLPYEIGSADFRVVVTQSCSGIGGIVLISAFSVVWLTCFRRDWRFPNALLLIPAAILFSWLLNSVRIAALILIGHYGSPDVAIGGFHSQAGWIFFNLAALLVFGVSRRITWFRSSDQLERPLPARPEPNPAAPYLLPFLAIIVASMFSGAASASSFEALYPLRFIAVVGCLFWMRHSYRALDWRFGWTGALAGVAVFALWMLVVRTSTPSDVPRGLESLSHWQAAGWLAVRTVASSVTVPVAEELAFRGFLLRFLISQDFDRVSFKAWTPLAVVVSSVAFGVMHGGQWVGGVLAGFVYAVAMLHRGRIGEAVAAHGITNALIAAWVLVTGDWSLW